MPEWVAPKNPMLPPQDASVFDSPVTKAIRLLAQLMGGYDPVGTMIGVGLSPMTVVAPEAKAIASMAGKGASKASKAPIRAYHGSPHDFDQFKLEKIGTGEGAQAYGHGLYFAENEAVAKSYADDLAKAGGNPLVIRKNGKVYKEGEALTSEVLDAVKYLEIGAKDAGQFKHNKLYYAKKHVGNMPEGPYRDRVMAALDDLADTTAAYEKRPGKTYEVDIHADPEQFLDWDKPLSQQGKVGQRMGKFVKPNQNERITATNMQRILQEYPASKAYQRDPEAGERYLEQVRAHLKTATDRSGMTGKDAWERIVQQENMLPSVASKALAKKGVPGLKYLDQGSRTAGQGTSNYVVFDDKLVSIVRKYMLAGMALDAAVQKAVSEQEQEPSTP